ncbi:MAG: hypothetical protein WC456_01445 [Patescibacteria group bacterium]
MSEIKDEFISHEHRHFKWRLGKHLASSLSGFIAGVFVTVIFFVAAFYMICK